MRKGSLQLSINAIVILIMAIAMLGVGIFFINSVRDEVTDFSGLTADAKEGIKTTLQQTGEKLSVSGLNEGTLVMGQNADENINVAILNSLDSSSPFLVDIVETKAASDDPDDFLGLTTFYKDTATRIAVGDLETIQVVFSSSNSRGRVIYTAEVWIDSNNDGDIDKSGSNADEFFGSKDFHVQVN